jgi:hypothetical protein
MADTNYSTSMFWSTASVAADAAAVVGPVLLLVSAAVWLMRRRNSPAFVAMFGGLLATTGLICQRYLHVDFVVMGSPVPAHGENWFLAFLNLYGLRFGIAVFGIATLSHFVFSDFRTSAKSHQQ